MRLPHPADMQTPSLESKLIRWSRVLRMRLARVAHSFRTNFRTNTRANFHKTSPFDSTELFDRENSGLESNRVSENGPVNNNDLKSKFLKPPVASITAPPDPPHVRDPALKPALNQVQNHLQYQFAGELFLTPAWIADSSGQLLWANKSLIETTAETLKNLTGWQWTKWISSEHRQKTISQFQDFYQRGLKTSTETRIHLPLNANDKNDLLFEVRHVAIFDKNQNLAGWFVTTTDISAQIELEDVQSKAHCQVMETLETMSDGFFSINSDWVFTYANHETQRFLQLSRTEIEGRTLKQLFPLTDRLKFESHYIHAMQSGTPAHFEESYDGRVLQVNAYRTSDGGLSIFYRDITEQIQVQQALAHQSQITRAITDNATSALFMMDKAGYPTFMNPAAEKITGYRLDEISDKPLHYAVHYKMPDGSFYPVERWPLNFNDDGPVHLKNQRETFVDKSGRLFPVVYSVSPIQRDGDVVGTVLEFQDITAQVKAQQALTQSYDFLINVIEGMNDAFFTVDSDWNFTRLNSNQERFTGKTRQELLRKNLWEIFPEAIDTKMYESAHEAMNKRTPAMFRGYVESLKLWLEFNIYPVSDGGIAVFYRDITVQVTANERVERERQKLENVARDLASAVAARDDFVSIASHELKTPLTSLKLQNQIIQRKLIKNKDTQVSAQELARITDANDRQINRLVRLVEDMLDISRLRSRSFTIHKSEVDLVEVARSTIDQLTPMFLSAGAAAPELQGPDKIIGFFDRGRIEQVFSNLLINAVKYGGKDATHFQLCEEPDRAFITVRDRGIGIKKEHHEAIFDRFQRAIDANEVSGLGLGLFITRKIVHLHNGKIWVESEPGAGSTFTVELPLKHDANDPVETLGNSSDPSPEQFQQADRKND